MAKTLRPVFTTFDRAAMPTNLLTVAEWRTFSRAVLKRDNWEAAARHYAERAGGALVMLASDALVVFTRRADGKISRSTHKPGTWGWAKA